MKTLESLSLQENRLAELDISATRWKSLTHLALSHNKIRSLQGLHLLPDLISLKLDFNDLSSLSSVGNLSQLRMLRISGNSRLTTLDVGSLSRLRTLYADFCDLREVSGLSSARRLENLSLRSQQSAKFRLSAPLPRRLRRLFLSGNPISKSLEQLGSVDAPQLQELVYLELAGCQLASLPSWLWDVMPNVRHLNVDHNLFQEVPHLTELTRLKRLSIVSCRIGRTASIVRAIDDLPLESLDTRSNPCTLGLYAPVPSPITGAISKSTHLPKGFAGTAAPFPHPAVVQPDFAEQQLISEEADEESNAHKSFFHKRLPDPPSGPSQSAKGVAQTKMNEAADERFIRALPADTLQQRILHRGVVAMACGRLRYLDGLPVHDEEVEEASQLLDSLSMPA